MKKILLSILFLCLAVNPVQAALSAATVWEVRVAGDGKNGGGFVAGATGTDFSQDDTCKRSWVAASAGGCGQASPTNTVNDLSCTNASPSVCSSATYNFAAEDVGNLIHIISGTNATAGWYEIVSVGSNQATLDRNCMTGAPSADITAYEGGALDIGSTSYDGEFAAAIVAGNTIYILGYSGDAVDYTASEAMTFTSGTDAVPVTIVGYITNRTTEPTDNDRPKIDAGAFVITSGGTTDVSNIIFTGTAAQVFVSGTQNTLKKIKVSNTSETADRTGIRLSANTRVFNCEAISTNGRAIENNGTNTQIYFSYFHDSKHCAVVGSTNSTYILNIFDTCSAGGLSVSSSARDEVFLIGNTFYGANTGTTGIDLSSVDRTIVMNNIINDWVTGITQTGTQKHSTYNNFYSNTSDGMTLGATDSSADPGFTDAANGNFAIGTNLKALGFPGAFQAGLSTGYLDMGAVQRQEPASSGGGGAWGF